MQACFEIVVLGCGGGPWEANTTGLLVRSRVVPLGENSFLAVDGGVHLSAVTSILQNSRDSECFGPLQGRSAATMAEHVVQRMVSCIAITHPHLDHLAGFIINTAGLTPNTRRTIAGLAPTIDHIKQHIFNDVIWPNLSTESCNGRPGADLVGFLRLREREYLPLAGGLELAGWPVTHGTSGIGTTEAAAYTSSAFFIRDSHSGRQVLVFGDVEADSVSTQPRNRGVWEAAADLHVQDKLAACLIECSFDERPAYTPLWGHLSPTHLMQEMQVLAGEVQRLGGERAMPLCGLTVIIIHVKDEVEVGYMGNRVAGSIRRLESQMQLGIALHLAVQGEVIRL